MNKNNVIHISTVHYWQDARIFDKECISLARAGYKVLLLIQHEGNIEKDGITIRGLPVSQSKLQRFTKTIPHMLWEVFKRPTSSILHLHDPELLLFGWLFKIAGFRVIYDVHEDLPKDIIAKEWIPSFLRKPLSFIVKKLEFILTAPLDGVVTVTPNIQKRFSHIKNVLVRNFPKLKLFLENTPSKKKEYVVYVGDIREVRGAKEMILAVSSLNYSIKLKLGGRIHPAEYKKELLALDRSGRVEFLGWVPHTEIPRLLEKALCGLVVLHPLEGYKEAYSVKMFEYMASGIPVIASDFPLWKEIIDNEECGLSVNPLSPSQIADSIKYLLQNPEKAYEMGINGRKAAKEKYNWENEEIILLGFYSEIVQKH